LQIFPLFYNLKDQIGRKSYISIHKNIFFSAGNHAERSGPSPEEGKSLMVILSYFTGASSTT
jgi:hypothetical protein